MALFWRPQLRVGHEQIDNDHRYLVLLVNTVELVIRFPEHPQHILSAIDELHEYAVRHFKREEDIQFAHHYVGYDEHCQEHRKLTAALVDMRERFAALLATPNLDPTKISAEAPEVAKFLRVWLIDHVLKNDLRMVGLFRD